MKTTRSTLALAALAALVMVGALSAAGPAKGARWKEFQADVEATTARLRSSVNKVTG